MQGELVGINPARVRPEITRGAQAQDAFVDLHLLVVRVARIREDQRARARLGNLAAARAAGHPAQGQCLAAGHVDIELVVIGFADRQGAAQRRRIRRLEGLEARAARTNRQVIGIGGRQAELQRRRRAARLHADKEAIRARRARVIQRQGAVVDIEPAVEGVGPAQDQLAALVLDEVIGAGAVGDHAVIGQDLVVSHRQEGPVRQGDAAVGIQGEGIGRRQAGSGGAGGESQVLGRGAARGRAQRAVRRHVQCARRDVGIKRVVAVRVPQRDRPRTRLLHKVGTGGVRAVRICAVGDLAANRPRAVVRPELHVAQVGDGRLLLPEDVGRAVAEIDRVAVDAVAVAGAIQHGEIVLRGLAHDVCGEFLGGQDVELHQGVGTVRLDTRPACRTAVIGRVQVIADPANHLDIAAGIADAVGPRSGGGAIVQRYAQGAVGRGAIDLDPEPIAGLQCAQRTARAALGTEVAPRHYLFGVLIRPHPHFRRTVIICSTAVAPRAAVIPRLLHQHHLAGNAGGLVDRHAHRSHHRTIIHRIERRKRHRLVRGSDCWRRGGIRKRERTRRRRRTTAERRKA